MNNPTATLPASQTPGAINGRAILFYIGQDTLKLKSFDKTTGASFTSAYLCPVMGGDPIKNELALDLAALAVAGPDLLAAVKSMLLFIDGYKDAEGTVDAKSFYQNIEAALPMYRDAVDMAERRVSIPGVISPEILAALNPQQ